MKRTLAIALIGFSAVTLADVAKTPLKTDKDKLSYTIGADIGNNFKRQGIEVDEQLMLRGYQDAISGKTQMTQKEMTETLNTFQTKLVAKHAEQFKKISADNKQKGEAFLAANKSKTGVVSLDNGLQYKVVQAGQGAKPKADDTVTVDYTGTLIDGTVFDSSEKIGKPATFKVSEVIPGWTQVLQLMNTGSTWEVYVPSELAYGERGVGGPIGPNQTLVFKIHLLTIEKPKVEKTKNS